MQTSTGRSGAIGIKGMSGTLIRETEGTTRIEGMLIRTSETDGKSRSRSLSRGRENESNRSQGPECQLWCYLCKTSVHTPDQCNSLKGSRKDNGRNYKGTGVPMLLTTNIVWPNVDSGSMYSLITSDSLRRIADEPYDGPQLSGLDGMGNLDPSHLVSHRRLEAHLLVNQDSFPLRKSSSMWSRKKIMGCDVLIGIDQLRDPEWVLMWANNSMIVVLQMLNR
ncbi:hypothetical protein SARC_00323 [Sphaeroforma arctica JP610]|uniref:Uncharacterized protein n=1 Tax=Sphaeroforma arctica JP610 TaxID=667725 RepID=A0A0L0GGU1_9EUKA|nr:hypothetical protein SARC_00323 [Sphaeroforma arctica JP610]KNC87558.1 hypothetical protein SARC_00323 [Sphaeroforma arctica JP610]|eukprot:XP_014161460.1 hypothetical protein SARC_00323 [Sphaeroforma arctica JP610]